MRRAAETPYVYSSVRVARSDVVSQLSVPTAVGTLVRGWPNDGAPPEVARCANLVGSW